MNINFFEAISSIKTPRRAKENLNGDYVVAVAFDSEWDEHWTALSLQRKDLFLTLDNEGEFTGFSLGNVSLREANLYWFATFEEAKHFKKVVELEDQIQRLEEVEDGDYLSNTKEIFDAFRRFVRP